MSGSGTTVAAAWCWVRPMVRVTVSISMGVRWSMPPAAVGSAAAPSTSKTTAPATPPGRSSALATGQTWSNDGTSNAFANAGTHDGQSRPGGTVNLQVPLTNSGNGGVTVTSGKLSVQGGSGGGLDSGKADAVLGFDGGTQTLGSGSSVVGAPARWKTAVARSTSGAATRSAA